MGVIGNRLHRISPLQSQREYISSTPVYGRTTGGSKNSLGGNSNHCYSVSAVIIKLLGFTAAMVGGPIGVYFLTVHTIFRGPYSFTCSALWC